MGENGSFTSDHELALNTLLNTSQTLYAPHQILVRFNTPEAHNQTRALSSIDQVNAIHALIGAQAVYSSSQNFVPGLQSVKIPDEMTVQDAVTWYQNQPSVLYAEPDHQVFLDDAPSPGITSSSVNTTRVPSDPFYPLQWNLKNTGQYGGTPGADIHAEEAWNLTTGSDVVVAVVDSGVDYLHPDLKDNIWTDPVTGLHGYNFYDNNTDVMDYDGHGTACAGIVAAVGNNGIGATGTAWKAKIMALKMSSGGAGWVSSAIQSYEYATLHHADIITNSWRIAYRNQALLDAIATFPGIMTWSASNEESDVDGYIDKMPQFLQPNVIPVMSTDDHDKKSSFSNYGKKSIFIAAPGSNILLLKPMKHDQSSPNSTNLSFQEIPYTYSNGTSFSSPMVAGVVALMKSLHPEYTNVQIKGALVRSADKNPDIFRYCIAGGRINASAAVRQEVSPYDAIGSMNMPPIMHTNTPFQCNITIQNAGTETWNSNTSISLIAQNRDAILMGPEQIAYPKGTTTAPGEYVSFTFQGTSPAQFGHYDPSYRLSDLNGGFGQAVNADCTVTEAEALPDVPLVQFDSAMISSGQYLYLIGGRTNDYPSNISPFRYDIVNKIWRMLTEMPECVSYVDASLINGKVYVPGGYNGSIRPSLCDPTLKVYDITNDSWSQTPFDRKVPGRWAYKTAVLGDRMYVMGGFIDYKTVTNQVFCLNTTTGQWSQAPSMLTNRTQFFVSSGNGTIIVAGGLDSYSGIFDFDKHTLRSAERFDGEKWSYLPDIPDSIGWDYGASGSDPDGSLWIAGGRRVTSEGVVYSDIAHFSVPNKSWTVTPDLPTMMYPRYHDVGCIAEDGYLYSAQGVNYSAY
ncbi:MAG: S8 family serine peptidase, partial [Methanospirillum sp.]|uniref:S8 family serine peptidase n=1 Tax=Methanospirillum sp. TaxID=45200 RepID=UPI00236A7136